MANIKELKKKIRSTKSSLKITTAMKLVSAAKLAKAQSAVVGARPYADELDQTIKTISALAKDYVHPFFKENEDNKMAHLLVISSNKGLCGGYNSQLIREVRAFTKRSNLDLKLHFMGKKAKDVLAGEVQNIGPDIVFKKQDPSYREIRELALGFAKDFERGEVGHLFVAYNVFHSAIRFTPTIRKLLPMNVDVSEKKILRDEMPFDFKYEPRADKILDTLIPETYINTLYTCLLDALAAEHGSRMSSMDSAANNCKDLIRKFTLKANKLRQAAITTELIEVVSGAESLNA
ncbi:MAG: ATP synthase F1 subunit gamma [Bacteriovoracales bacterium]|nr:ATP synthase F1 subunit gamma [Bacteriovoracales bacterium]